MKAYSIGRDPGCNIVINDCTDVVSRRHAILNVSSNGKMTITDQSSNGTYVNGIRITPNVAVPVTRKDIISLAHVAQLDWDSIPKSNNWKIYVISALSILLIGGISYFFINQDYNNNINKEEDTTIAIDTLKNNTAPKDTTQTNKKDNEEKKDTIDSKKSDKKQPKKSEPKKQEKKDKKENETPKEKTEVRPVI